MQKHIIDLIVYLVGRLQTGDELRDIELENLSRYDESEISAAYSWVLQKYNSGELDHALAKKPKDKISTPPRILHYAERVMISKDAYGYLMELYHMRIISFQMMEQIIEQAMLHVAERLDENKVKQLLTDMLFDRTPTSEKPAGSSSQYLKGNESIN